MLPGVDGMETAWNLACMEFGRRAGKAGGISGADFMGSPGFGSVFIVRREGEIFGKRWLEGMGGNRYHVPPISPCKHHIFMNFFS